MGPCSGNILKYLRDFRIYRQIQVYFNVMLTYRLQRPNTVAVARFHLLTDVFRMSSGLIAVSTYSNFFCGLAIKYKLI